MTALKPSDSTSSSQTLPGIAHACLRRKSPRTYELLDPKKPGEAVSFDVGQIRDIVVMDKRLREGKIITSVPAGYAEFATRFNKYATGPERFATYAFIKQKLIISKDGSPIVWEHFLIDGSLIDGIPVHLSGSGPTSSPQFSDNAYAERTGDSVAEALSAYMKGALSTTDELTRFWMDRGAIELQYASSLAQLAERPFGRHEPSEFRNIIDGFRLEAARQAMAHNTLTKQIVADLEARCLEFISDQKVHLRDVCEPAVKRLQEEPLPTNSPSAGISSEWKKEYMILRHILDMRQFDSMRKFKHRSEMLPLRRNHLEDNVGQPPSPMSSSTKSREWEDLLKSCKEMEANRIQFMKELLSAYADVLTSIEAADHESHSNIMRTFDLFRSEDILEDFVKNFTTAQASTQDLHFHPPASPLISASNVTSSSDPQIMPLRAVLSQRRSTMTGSGRFSGPRPRPFSLRPSSQIIDSSNISNPLLNCGRSSVHVLSTSSFLESTRGASASQSHARSRLPIPKLQTNLPKGCTP